MIDSAPLNDVLLGDSLGTFDGLRDARWSPLCFLGDFDDDLGGTTGDPTSDSGFLGELAACGTARSGELAGELGMPGNSELKAIIELIIRSGEVGGLLGGVFNGDRCFSGDLLFREGEVERNFSLA